MSDGLEQAARAIREELVKIGYGVGTINAGQLSVGVAPAALRAVREPSEAMLNAARDWSAAKYGKPIGNDAAVGCWTAMLNAILAPEQPK